jgi:hypothetical protein
VPDSIAGIEDLWAVTTAAMIVCPKNIAARSYHWYSSRKNQEVLLREEIHFWTLLKPAAFIQPVTCSSETINAG